MTARPAATVAAGESDRDALRTWLRLLACATLVEREVRGRLRDRFDTTLPRFDVLAQLDAAAAAGSAAITMSALSERLMVTNGNVTALVERLAADGLVARTPSPTDGRAQLVRLTPRGGRALAAMAPEHHRWIGELFAALTADEQRELHRLLGKLKASLRAPPGGDDPEEPA